MDFFTNLFGTREKTALGIDIGTSAIKIVQLKKSKGHFVLSTYGSLALGPYSGLEVGRSTNLSVNKTVEALTDILSEAKTTTRKCGLAIPFSSSLMSLIELPNLDQDQLESMIPIEARKYIPVPISEVSLDWSVIPKNEGEKESDTLDVMLVAIHNEILKRLESISSKTPLQTDFYEIEIFSTLRSVNAESSVPEMVIDMGSSSTKVFIVERGAVRESHTINKGSQNLTLTLSNALQVSVEEAEIMKRERGLLPNQSDNNQVRQAEALKITLDYIFNEVFQLQDNFERENKKKIKKVVLVGGGSSLKGLIDVVKEKFKVEAYLADPFSMVEAPEFIKPTLKEIGPEFAVAFGLAIRALREQ